MFVALEKSSQNTNLLRVLRDEKNAVCLMSRNGVEA